MLLRNKKEIDENKGKWIGVGGKFEKDETPEICAAREMREETGLTPDRLIYRGIVYFYSENDDEEMHLFTCTEFKGTLTDCDEGTLEWIKKEEVTNLNLWEGDRVFLKLLAVDAPFFRLELRYQGEKLVEAKLL